MKVKTKQMSQDWTDSPPEQDAEMCGQLREWGAGGVPGREVRQVRQHRNSKENFKKSKKYPVVMTPLGLPLTVQCGRANNNKTISYKLNVV